MKKIIFIFMMLFITTASFAGRKDSTLIKLQKQNAELMKMNQNLMNHIDEISPEDDGYQVIKLSPIEELSLEQNTGEIRAFGTGESHKEQIAYNVAYAQASAALQKKMEQYIRYGLDEYNSSVGVNDQYSINERTREQVVSACKAIVNGITVIKTRKLYNRNTKRYKYEMCVKYDRETILKAIKKSQDEHKVMVDEKQFERDMQSAWDELDAEHNKEAHNPEMVISEEE